MKTAKQPANAALRIAKLSFGGFIARRYFLGVLAISLVKMTRLQAFATDAPDAAPSVKPTPSDREIAIDAQLDGVLKFDREIASREDMTLEAINKGSTAALLKHFLSSKMAVWLSLYDDPNLGVRRSLRGSRTLTESFRRPDIIQAFIDWNQNLIPVLNQMAPGSTMGKGISSRIMGGDALLQYPEMVKKWKGFEKPLLRVMCARYRAMTQANARYTEAAKPLEPPSTPWATSSECSPRPSIQPVIGKRGRPQAANPIW